MRLILFCAVFIGFNFIYSPLAAQVLTGKFTAQAQRYFDKNRNHAVLMRAFFQNMPKGGDLHHHLSGSVYAETYIDWALEKKLFVNIQNGELLPNNSKNESHIITLKAALENPTLNFRQKVISDWSAYFYSILEGNRHNDFFKTFFLFYPAYDNNEVRALQEIRKRAVSQNLQYIETMAGVSAVEQAFSEKFSNLTWDKSKSNLENFKALQAELANKDLKALAKMYADSIQSIHERSKLADKSDENLQIRYQLYGLRVLPPAFVFARLMLIHQADEMSDLVVGVNFVAPEDNLVSMQDYQLHMEMFAFLNAEFPNVKLALHAGELRLGLVKPEDLNYHIHDAIFKAKAKRIGHGTDIAHEKNLQTIFKEMREKGIAVELPLVSNEFILDIKNDEHPISLYLANDVPVVLASDDEGVLRTDITQQFVLAALRYPQISYLDLKKMVFNSINFSFLPAKEKNNINQKLSTAFDEFERGF